VDWTARCGSKSGSDADIYTARDDDAAASANQQHDQLDLMAGKEEEEEAEKWMLRPCTGGSAATKRKAVARSSYKAGDPPPEGWVDVYELAVPASSDFDPFGSERRAAAIDKLLQDAKLPAAPVAAKQAPAAAASSKPTRRLTKGEIMSIVALKPEPFPSADYLDELAEFDPPDSIAERRRQHEEDAAYFGDMDEKFEEFRQEVIRGLKEDGYYEVDEDYLAGRDKAKKPAWKPFAFLDPGDLRGRVATPEQHQRWLREGCIRQHVPNDEEALLVSYGEDDDSMGAGEDSDASDDEEDVEAQVADARSN
jgi:hypothetical protein